MDYAPICPAENPIERLAHRYMTYWHGEGAPHQHRYYRCKGCHGLVTWKMIRKGGCDCNMSKELVPANLTMLEKARILGAPWTL